MHIYTAVQQYVLYYHVHNHMDMLMLIFFLYAFNLLMLRCKQCVPVSVYACVFVYFVLFKCFLRTANRAVDTKMRTVLLFDLHCIRSTVKTVMC